MLPCRMIYVAIHYGKTLTVECTNYNYTIHRVLKKFSIDYFSNAMTLSKQSVVLENAYQLQPLEVIINKNN